MFEWSTVLNALKVIWGLVGCLLGLSVLISFVLSTINGIVKHIGGKKHAGE